MPDDLDYDDDNLDEPSERDNLRDLRRAAKDGNAAKAELAAAKRELALVKAGVDVDSTLGKYFAKAYDGDPDPVAIKAAWAEIAPSAEPTAPPAPADDIIDPAEAASTAERQALANGAPADVVPQPDVRAVMNSNVEAMRARGAREGDILGSSFETLVAAAASGDRSVIIDNFRS